MCVIERRCGIDQVEIELVFTEPHRDKEPRHDLLPVRHGGYGAFQRLQVAVAGVEVPERYQRWVAIEHLLELPLLGRERKVARGDWHVFAPVLGLPVLYYIGGIILYIKYVMYSKKWVS